MSPKIPGRTPTTADSTILTDGSQKVQITNFPTTPPISGNVSVSNFPTTQAVSGNVTTTGTVTVSNLPATQAVTGSVSVTNFPTTEVVSIAASGNTVNIGNTSLPVTGAFYPATQPVSGSVSVSNLPITQAVSGSVTTSGTVAVTNFPATQPVSGSVSVTNFPTTEVVSIAASGNTVNIGNSSLPVTGAFYPATQPVSGSVAVSNFPPTQPVSGSVSVGNFPATQAVSGTITVSNPTAATDVSTLSKDTSTVAITTSLGTDGATPPILAGTGVRGWLRGIYEKLTGTLTIGGTVAVNNFPASQAVTGTFFQTTQPVSGNVNVGNFPATQPVSGSVSVGNFPATQPVSGSVSVSNLPTIQSVGITTSANTVTVGNASLPVTGTFFQTTQPVSGSVSVGNFPATQAVSGSVTTSGTVAVTNFPATQPVSGTVTVSNPTAATDVSTLAKDATLAGVTTSLGTDGTAPPTLAGSGVRGWLRGIYEKVAGTLSVSGSVSVTNFPTTEIVSIAASGNTVNIGNASLPVTGAFYPATQPVSGSVNVGNFPATQAVTGSFFQATQPVSGSVSVGNFPATQAVTGTFFQATQPVSGSVSVGNFPATQAVTGTVTVSNPTAATDVSTLSKDTSTVAITTSLGTDGTTPPTLAGTGVRGWLRGIYEKLAGTLSITGTVGVNNFPASQAVTGSFFQATQPVSGSVSVGNFPATQAVTGTVTVGNASLPVTGSFFQATQPVSGSVSVGNFPVTQAVTGTVTVGNASLPVTGAFFQATQPVSGSVSVGNFPASQAVTGAFFQATQPVSATALTDGTQKTQVTNFPATQAISAVSLPLPTGAAQDGTDITTPTAMPVGGSGIRGWLSSIWTKLNGTLSTSRTWTLASGTDSVSVSNFPASQAVTGTFFQATQPVSGTVALGAGAAAIGTVTVGNFPATQAVSGSVSVSNLPVIQSVGITTSANTVTVGNTSLPVTGTFFQATQPVAGIVSVSNFPATQAVSIASMPSTPVTGTFFQTTQPVSGTVTVSNPTAATDISTLAKDTTLAGVTTSLGTDGTTPPTIAGTGVRGWLRGIYEKVAGTLSVSGAVSVSNFPATQAVSGTFYQATQPVSGSVSVGNFPATQAVSGAVSVSNFPAIQSVGIAITANTVTVGNASLPVTGTFFQATQPVSATALTDGTQKTQVTNFPATQAVSGTFFQTTQPVSGSVNVGNFPATQAVTGTFYQATQPVSGSVSVGNFPATQAISAASLPLPSGAAQDGTDITTPTAMPIGGSGIRGWLSSIWTKLNGTLSTSRTWTLASGTDSVSVSNFPATQTVAGSVSVSNFPATQAVTGTFFQATQPVSGTVALGAGAAAIGTVSVTNFPATQAVSIASMPTTPVTGTFFQTTQPVSGTVTVSNPTAATDVSTLAKDVTLAGVTTSLGTDGTTPPTIAGTGVRGWLRAIYEKVAGTLSVSGSVSVSNFPATQAVSGTFFQTTQPVSGSVSVGNFPVTQAVSLAVAPTTPVTGTFFQATQPVSGSVSVGNFPATQAVSGTVAVSNIPSPISTAPASDTGQSAIPVRIISQLGAGSGGSASSVSISDGTTATQKLAIDASGRASVTVTNTSLPVTGAFFQATQPVSGSISVSNFPATQAISAAALPLPSGAAQDGTDITTPTAMPAGGSGIRGWLSSIWTKLNGTLSTSRTWTLASGTDSVSVSNFPATQTVAGSVSVSNFPASQAVTGTFFQATQPVSGTVTLGAGAAAIGTVTVGNASLPVTGTFFQATQPVSGSVSVGNFPATQAVTGTFFQTTQPVSATALTDGTQKGQVTVLNSAGTATSVGLASGNLALPVQVGTSAQLAIGVAASAQPHGTLRVTPDPTSFFYDAFTGSILDTTDRWNTTGTPPTQTNGVLSFPAAAASTTSILYTKPVITVSASQYVFPAMVVKLETGTGTGVGRFFGLGTPPTTPSTTSLAQEGVGFELDATTGALQAVTYTSGAKTVIAALTKPTDGANHRYSMQYRNSRTWWFIDDINVFVTTATFLNTTIQDLNGLISCVSGAAPANTPLLTMTAFGVSDLNRQATQISDGVFGFRKVTVGKNGGLSVKGSSIAGATLNIPAAGAATMTSVDVSEAGNATFTLKNTVAANPFGTGLVLVFEQSDDNVSWSPLTVVRSTDGAALSTYSGQPANTANVSIMFDTAMEGVNFARARAIAGPATNGATVVCLPSGMPFTPVATVIQQPLTKGTQGASGVSTQDLKDAGRALVSYYMLIPVAATAIDTLQSLTGTKAGATVAATATPAVTTTGKNFRIQRLSATYIATATSGYGMVRLRYNPVGIAAITSPVLLTMALGSAGPTTANATGTQDALIPDGLEVGSGAGIGISVQGFAAGAAAASGFVLVSISGYEY